MNPVLPSKHLI